MSFKTYEVHPMLDAVDEERGMSCMYLHQHEETH